MPAQLAGKAWRLPTRDELYSAANSGMLVLELPYWTASRFEESSDGFWAVASGEAAGGRHRYEAARALCIQK